MVHGRPAGGREGGPERKEKPTDQATGAATAAVAAPDTVRGRRAGGRARFGYSDMYEWGVDEGMGWITDPLITSPVRARPKTQRHPESL